MKDMVMRLDMLPAHLMVNGTVVPEPTEPAWFWEQFGCNPRIQGPPTPAPAGHRNNQDHLFDDLGVAVAEFHATGLVTNVAVLLDNPRTRHWYHPKSVFNGTVHLNGAEVKAGMKLDDLPLGDDWRFTWKPLMSHAIARVGDHSVALVMERRGRGRDPFRLIEAHYGYSSRKLRFPSPSRNP